MPLYEYECAKCGHRFEKIEKVTAPARQKCPKCGGKAARQLAAPAIQFKGSGWYVTDYAGKGKKSEGEKTESKEAKEAKESKDSKPATSSKEASKKSD